MAISPDHKNALVQSLVLQSRGAPSLMAEHIAAKQEWCHPNTTIPKKTQRMSTIYQGGLDNALWSGAVFHPASLCEKVSFGALYSS